MHVKQVGTAHCHCGYWSDRGELGGFTLRLDAASHGGCAIMKAVKTYATRLDADLAKIELDAAGVPAVVVGVGTEAEGGAAGVQLLVPEEWIESALRILEQS